MCYALLEGENTYIVPVRLGVKVSKNGKASLYVIISNKKIGVTAAHSAEYATRPITYSVQQIIDYVNTDDAKILFKEPLNKSPFI